MKFNIKKLEKSKIELEVEISKEELNDFINKAIINLGKDFEIDGFRKGMVPKEIVEEKIGKENILIEAADLAIKENYRKIILENKIEAISQPEIDIIKLAPDNPLIFKATIAVLPEFKLPDYKKIASKVKRNKIFVEDREVDEALNWLGKSRAKFILKDGSCQKGDFVEIEYSIFYGGILKDKIKDAFILGEGHFISGFEDALIGMSSGDTKEKISLKMPENYYIKDLAGKEIEVNIKMISVQKLEFPNIDDSFAKSLGNFNNLEDLKKSIREGIFIEKEQLESQRVRNEILKNISKEIDFEIPDVLIESEKDRMLNDFKESVSLNLKMSFNDYLNNTKRSEEEIRDSFSEEATIRVKHFLILRELGRVEKIEVSNEEIEEEINKILKNYESIEKAKKELDLEKLKLYTDNIIRNEKIFKILESFAQQEK